jgi:hypothetical protein
MLAVLAQDPDSGIIDYGTPTWCTKMKALWFWNLLILR